jgi:hypothetical protein
MTRRLLCAGAGLVALALAGPAPANPDRPGPERLLVRGTEFDLTLSKRRPRPGPVVIQFLNDGEDPHDLRVRRADDPSAPEIGFGELGPGEYESIETRLRKRTAYVLWCSLPEHRGLGMDASLRTKRRRQPR